MSQPRLAVTRHDNVAIVTFDRPERRNAFDLAMWAGLQAIMEALSNDGGLRCVVLRGAGTEAFSAGADISAFEAERGTRELEDRYAAQLHTSMQSIRLCRHPVVAMIFGYCLGGGAGIATMCDFRVGGESSRFGITARNLGIWYPYAEIDPIVQMAGIGVVAEILIEGRIFSGREAYEKGLLSRVVPDAEVEREAMALARRVAEGSPSRRALPQGGDPKTARSAADQRGRGRGGERLRRHGGFPKRLARLPGQAAAGVHGTLGY